ncbi:MAG: hypothetical protein WCH04_20245 [Gammaproteobacteria bacterium]
MARKILQEWLPLGMPAMAVVLDMVFLGLAGGMLLVHGWNTPFLVRWMLVGALVLLALVIHRLTRPSSLVVLLTSGFFFSCFVKAWFDYGSRPVLVTLVLGAVLLAVHAPRLKGWLRVAAVNGALVLALLALAEGWSGGGTSAQQKGYSTWRITESGARVALSSHSIRNLDLGKAAQPGVVIREQMQQDGQTDYDVTYTIDDDGLRRTPDTGGPQAAPVLLFGGSYMFGEGVNDADTLGAVLARSSGRRVDVINHAYIGYGPHQMLSILENGLDNRELKGRKPLAGVYLAIRDHIRRTVGLAPWDSVGPRYYLDGDGHAYRAGNFDDGFEGRLLVMAKKSALFSRLVSPAMAASSRSEALFTGVVATAAKLFHQRYGVPLRVVYWGTSGDAATGRQVQALRAQGLEVMLVEQWLPGIAEHPLSYVYAHDWHPTPLAQCLLGVGIAQWLGVLDTAAVPDCDHLTGAEHGKQKNPFPHGSIRING